MSIKKSENTLCKYCKKTLSNPHEIELNYHSDCFESFQEFKKTHQIIEKKLSKALSLSEKRIIELIKDKKIQYTLNDNEKIIELKISDTHIPTFPLAVPELKEIQILSITNHFTHEEYVDPRIPPSVARDGFYRPYDGLESLTDNIGDLKNLKVINLSGNTLMDFPDSISNLEKLKELNIEGNGLRKLPEAVTKIKNLEKLDLSYNPITSLPESIENLKNLKKTNN